MQAKDWITIVAVLLSPIIAVGVTLWHQKISAKRVDKKNILSIIMMYRGVTAREDDFIKAINLIDIYFSGNKEVIGLLRKYLHYLTKPLYETGEYHRILLDLILAMAKDLGYTSLKATDIMDHYYPEKYSLSNPIKPVISEK